MSSRFILSILMVFMTLSVQAVDYTGNAAGGFNIFVWYGDEIISECRHEERSAGGVSSGTDLTFDACWKASDFGLDGEVSTADDNSYFKVTTSDYKKFVVKLYSTSDCSGSTLWETTATESLCACEQNIYGGCFIITVPTWSASLWKGDDCAGNPDELETNLLKNKCYNGAEEGAGNYMLWTFQCQDGFNCRRGEQPTTVRHQLVFGCDNTCDSRKCTNTWTVAPTDCKCDSVACILSDFSNNSFAVSASLVVSLAAMILSLFM